MITYSQTNYKYILSCVDHFSKYKWTQLIPNKEAQTLAKELEHIFKNIEFVHGFPYYPQSQGVVEKPNNLIAKSLTTSHQSYKVDNKKPAKWDIDAALKAWTASSNRNVHSVTKKVPYLAIHIKDTEEIEDVKSNIETYYANKNKTKTKRLDIKVGSKVFIIREVKKVKTKNKLINKATTNVFKEKSKSQKVRIPAEVVDISGM